MFVVNLTILTALVGSVIAIKEHNDYRWFLALAAIALIYIVLEPILGPYFKEYVLTSKDNEIPSNLLHNEKRAKTYPSAYTNSWYHFCDSEELKNGQVKEFRALGRVFVLWRDNNGKVVCQDAFCVHQGANLGRGGKVVDNCIVCPFHNWKIGSDGSIMHVPYLKDPTSCQNLSKKQKTYHCIDWCNLVLVYFHADDKDPDYFPPQYVVDEFKEGNWVPHTKWSAGFVTFSPVDMVDQAADYAHFATLHGDFKIPWTKICIPDWVLRFIPLAISHTTVTYRGDDKEWAEKVKETGWGTIDKNLLFFTDLAGLTWKGKVMEKTLSQTTEMFIGPAMIVFHIPFTIGKGILWY
jgi:nitrite reductase/ring-hydroxylating ferredoxin subunit